MFRVAARAGSLNSTVPSTPSDRPVAKSHTAQDGVEKPLAAEEDAKAVWKMIAINVQQEEDRTIELIDTAVSQIDQDRDDVDSIASSRPTSPRPTVGGVPAVPSEHMHERPRSPPLRHTMNDYDLYHAKVLVLDLLGWGVPPEYIISRGVSKQLVTDIFRQLRLKLPASLAN